MAKLKGYWFVECDPVSNEHLASLLTFYGFGEPEQCIRRDAQDRSHHVWQVPSELIARLKQAKQLDDRNAYHQFRFFTAHNFNGTIYPADFIEKKYQSKKVKEARKMIDGLVK